MEKDEKCIGGLKESLSKNILLINQDTLQATL